MKSVNVDVKALLESSVPVFMADLYTLTIDGNYVYRWTSWHQDLTYSTITWSASGPIIKRGGTRCVAGLESDTLDITLEVSDSITLYNIPIQLAAVNKALDNATVKLERAYMSTPGTVLGTIVLFEGYVAEVSPTSTTIKLSVKSELDKLNISQPHNIFSPKCQNCLYGPACGVNKESFTVSGVVQAGSTKTSIITTLIQPDGHFNLGGFSVYSGASAGAKSGVLNFVNGVITLRFPLPHTPAPGDSFTVYPGCDHSVSMCQSKFANKARFRGFPFVPRVETTR